MAALIDIFPCRSDNFGYLVHDTATGRTASIDAPDAAAILAALKRTGWKLTDLFITHHHTDHVEGIPALIWINSPANPHGRILSADEMRAWVWAKQLWNPELDTKALMKDFVFGYYKAAAAPIWDYQMAMWAYWEKWHKQPHKCGEPSDNPLLNNLHCSYAPDGPMFTLAMPQSLPAAARNCSASRRSVVKIDEASPWGTALWAAMASSRVR